MATDEGATAARGSAGNAEGESGSVQGEQRCLRLLESRFPPSAPSRALHSMPWTGPLDRMLDGLRRGVDSPVHRR
eukprot:scaffold169608_cov21-Tisochrysis_lutea.AAC.1